MSRIYSLLKKIYIAIVGLVHISLGIVMALRTIFGGKYDKIPIEPDRSVLIMGNGPSLKETDIEKIAKSVTDIVCVNFYPLKDDKFFVLKPNYLCLIDPVFFKANAEKTEQKKVELLNQLEKVDWKLTIITKQNRKLPIKNPNISYTYLNSNVLPGKYAEKFKYFLYRKNLLGFGSQNVVIGASFYFVIKKSKVILLAGVDMSEFKMLQVDQNNEVYVNAQHHYGKETIKHSEMGLIKTGEFYKLLNCYVKMFEQFYFLEKFADSQGVKIYNLSPNSFIDVFEKDNQYQKISSKGE